MKTTRISATTIKLILLAIFTSLILTASAEAATYTVTKTADTNDGVCDTDCSLREAIAVANGTVANDIIEFDATLFGAAQTITLGGTTLTIANNGTLTINGTGASVLTVSGNNVSQVFLVNSGATAEISGLTVTAGRNTGGNGGGIVANSTSTLTLRSLRIMGNFGQSGGGILALSGSAVNLSDSTVSNNDSARASGSLGGGIQNNLGTVNISNSTFTGNNAAFGGGIFNNGSMTISNSTFSGNTANNGAGIANGASFTGGGSTITINNSTISGNTATNQGGGFYNVTSATTNTATLNSSTISGNTSAASQGGGIFNTGTLTLNNSISANSATGGDCVRTNGTANATYSLIEDNLTCVNGTNSNNLTGNPNLGALQNNGGATFTHALLAGSIATDKGNSSLTQDQRGSLRPVNDPNSTNGTGNLADIGAYEVQAPGGDLDLPFAPNVGGGFVSALAVQPDGIIVIGGFFTLVNGVARNNIARLNADGSLDTGFLNGLSGTNGVVRALAVQTDGKVVIGGQFTTVNGVGRNFIARLNADGSLDTGFLNGLSGANNPVQALAVQPDGKIVIGGQFTTVNGVGRNLIARLNADGSLDAGFLNGLSGASDFVFALAVQPDSKVVIGGDFTTVNGTARTGLARLLPFPPAMSGALQFSATGYSVNENAGTALITITRTGGSEGTVTVNYATSNGTATAGSDYTSASGTLTFLDGETSKTFTVPVTDDTTQETLETVNLTLSAPTGGATLGTPASAVLTIVDNDGFTISGRIADGSNAALADIPVTLSGAVTRTILTDASGNYSFTNLPAGRDYTVRANSPYHVFTPARADFNNLTANQTQNFTGMLSDTGTTPAPLADNFGGPNRDPERWSLGTLSQPPGALDPLVTVAQTNGQLVITPRANVDSLHYNGYVSVNSFDLSNGQISVELALAGINGAESIFSLGIGGDAFLRFIVVSPRPNQLLQVQPVIDGVKQAPLGVTVPTLMFQFVQNGQIFLNVAIPYDSVAHRFLRFRHLARDANNNPANFLLFETSPEASAYTERARSDLGERSVSAITVELAGGTGGAAGNPGPIIFDNLVTQVVNARFNLAAVTVSEGAGSVTLNVTRTGLTNLTGTMEYSTQDGTATQRTRYVAASGVLNFAAGETSKSFQILLQDNALVDGSQDFNVFLGPGQGMGVNGPGRTTVTITDNDSPPITTNPLETPSYFVTQQYYDFLSRQPDQAGLDFWVGQIVNPCGGNPACISQRRWNVSNAFFFELEFQQTGSFVYRLYRAAYGNQQPFPNSQGDMDAHPFCTANPQNCSLIRASHVPSYAKFINDRARLDAAQLATTQLALANAFVNRAEFRQRYPTTQAAAQFVDALLANIQSASGANLTSQRDALIVLHGSGGRGTVLYRLADDNAAGNPINNRAFIDAEYSRSFVLTQYFGYLRRDPDMPGLNFWLAIVNRFPLRSATGQNAMVCAFITSGEYQTRFSLITPRTDAECPTPP